MVVPLMALWIPIVLAAVFVFVASSIIHMVLPYHKTEYHQLPDEDKILAAMRPYALKPGIYNFPFCDHNTLKTPEVQAKFKQGPVGFLSIRPNGPVNMGSFLGLWFGFCVVVSIFTAYLTGRTVAAGAPYLMVFRVAGTTAFMAYGVGLLSNGIWKGQPWSMVFKEFFDGIVYCVLTAVAFAWLWPHA